MSLVLSKALAQNKYFHTALPAVPLPVNKSTAKMYLNINGVIEFSLWKVIFIYLCEYADNSLHKEYPITCN